MTTYRTRDGDMLDSICWDHYGSTGTVEAVLAANPGLCELGPVLPHGVEIALPDLPEPVAEAVRLWQ